MRTRIFIAASLLSQTMWAQTFTETITKELVFEKPSPANALIVSNINGGIKVEGYSGDKILLEVKKTINAKTDERLDRGKAELQLGVMDRADTVIFYISDGCNQFIRSKRNGRNSGSPHQGGWGYQSINSHGCNLVYDYTMDFTLKVPASVNLSVNTINEGDVIVNNVNGIVKASNINGNIRLTRLKGEAEAHTINGDVDIEYVSIPEEPCRFYTLNGDINAFFPPALSANLTFESFNGSFYTNMDDLESLPQKVIKSNRGEGLQYKITGNQFKVGNGGPLLAFETFNGNVYLKKSTK